MDLNLLIDHLQADTLRSLERFGPELALCVTILVMLGMRVFDFGRRIDPFFFALIGTLAALYFGAPWKHLATGREEIFTGMLVYDGFTVYLRAVLVLFMLLFVVFTKLSGIPDREDGADVYTLFLGATLGMCLMSSANHLLVVFLAVEMASVPSYALAGLLKGRKQGSEAALKYSVYGAGAAGIMLYGISLLAGLANSAHLPTIAVELAAKLPTFEQSELMVLAFGGLMLGVGLAFKLSAVPFHFWAPDVFEGATAEVNAFLSVASKAAALALLVRVCIGVGYGSPGFEASAPAVAANQIDAQPVVYVALQDDATPAASDAPASPSDGPAVRSTTVGLTNARDFIAKIVALFAVITCTFGNLAAYGQTNIKRLLAYSTIAHAGYMLMAVPPLMALIGVDDVQARAAIGALALYIAVYVFMNLGAFAVVAFLRNAMRSEDIADYAGLIRRAPGVVVCFSLILFSLVGLPPLSGFIGKFAIFAALVNAYTLTGHNYLVVLLVVGGVNTAISLFYYLRVVKVMTIDPEPEQRVPFSFPLVSLPGMYLLAVTIPTAILMLSWERLNRLCLDAVSQLLT